MLKDLISRQNYLGLLDGSSFHVAGAQRGSLKLKSGTRTPMVCSVCDLQASGPAIQCQIAQVVVSQNEGTLI